MNGGIHFFANSLIRDRVRFVLLHERGVERGANATRKGAALGGCHEEINRLSRRACLARIADCSVRLIVVSGEIERVWGAGMRVPHGVKIIGHGGGTSSAIDEVLRAPGGRIVRSAFSRRRLRDAVTNAGRRFSYLAFPLSLEISSK